MAKAEDPLELATPVKGRADWREYKAVRLTNGVTVLLVHDSESKTLSAAATVNVGASADPRSGLAHFCEHMCFLGSRKYPGENEYKQYLSRHGGRSNASTSMHVTTYKFEIVAEFGDHALDLFAQFFVDPLFTPSGTNREVRAVDSENSKNLVADGRRRLQILKAVGDSTHYYTKFTTGNEKTLPTGKDGEDSSLRRELLDFHRLHYRPDRMTVVVAGPQSLTELEEMVVPKFADMKKRDFPSDVALMTETERLVFEAAKDAPPYGHEAPVLDFRSAFGPTKSQPWPRVLISKPLVSMRKLSLLFPVPPCKNPDQSPASVVCHILGHEGPGSVFGQLQNFGWASALSAGLRVDAPDFGLLQIDVTLTPAGEDHWKEVVQVVLEDCHNVREAAKKEVSTLERLWEESIRLAEMQFHTASPTGVYDTAPRLSQRVLRYGTKQALSAGSCLNESRGSFPLEAVRKFMEHLTVENLLVERCSEQAWDGAVKDEKTEIEEEKWYGINYVVYPLETETVKDWQRTGVHGLHLPGPNPFIPRTLDLCPDLPESSKEESCIEKEMNPPVLLVNDHAGHLWHRLDDRYALPKAAIRLLVRNPRVHHCYEGGAWVSSPASAIHASLLSTCFSQALAQELYDANLAGLHWSISLGEAGITISCSGFSDRLSDLALRVVKSFIEEDFLEERYFESARDRLLRNLRTYFTSRRADSYASYYRDLLLSSESPGLEASITACEEATIDSLRQYHFDLWESKLTMECLYAGNVGAADAKHFYNDAASAIMARTGMDESEWIPGGSERRVQPGNSVELHFASRNDQEESGAVTITFQSSIPGFRGEMFSSKESLQSTASIRLLSHMLREPLFNELRTKQTLGYIVNSYYDLGISHRPPELASLGPLCVPVDMLEVSVLSRKVSPPEIADRIDKFLDNFRMRLLEMPESEIQDHVLALSTKLLKPIQKLNSEVSTQFTKIRRYTPEVAGQSSMQKDLPWNSLKVLASQIRITSREDLMNTWDRMVSTRSRSRLVTCVYGSTFPLENLNLRRPQATVAIRDSIAELVQLRRNLKRYDNTATGIRRDAFLRLSTLTNRPQLWMTVVAGAIATGFVGWTMLSRARKTTSA